MKRLLILLSLLIPTLASAQMEIDNLPTEQKSISFRDSIVKRNSDMSIGYYSAALERHNRKLLRQDRNDLEVSGSFQGSFASLNDAWLEASGGGNSLLLRGVFSLNHTYTKDRFSLQTSASAKFGYYRLDIESEVESDSDDFERPDSAVWYKDQDEFQISIAPSFKMSKNWSYGAILKFRSQFADGYVSRTAQESYNLKSTFMSPGYLDISVGFNYTCPKEKFPVKINLSPIALSATYVTDAEVRENAQYSYKDPADNSYAYTDVYGVSPNKSSLYEGGSSVQIDFDRHFGKDDWLRYTTTMTSFYGWMTQLSNRSTSINNIDRYNAAIEAWETDPDSMQKPTLTTKPTVRWENQIEIKATKYISTVINYELYYNRAQVEGVQTQAVLSVGLSYTFKSK